MNKNNPSHSLYSIIDIRFADPVIIGINERYVVIGTMMGSIKFTFSIKKTPVSRTIKRKYYRNNF